MSSAAAIAIIERNGGSVGEKQLERDLSAQGIEPAGDTVRELIGTGALVRDGLVLVAGRNGVDPAQSGDGPLPGVPPRRDRQRRSSPYTDVEIRERLLAWELEFGCLPGQDDWDPSKLRRAMARLEGKHEGYARKLAVYEAGDFPSAMVVRERFGSWNAARVNAGFEPREPGRPVASEAPRRMPTVGPEALRKRFAAVERARELNDVELKTALYELGAAALVEADAIKTDLEGGDGQ